jgi:chaperonin cofactor prefoldin
MKKKIKIPPQIQQQMKRFRKKKTAPPTLDDQLSAAQLVLRDGHHDHLSNAVANARDILNNAYPNGAVELLLNIQDARNVADMMIEQLGAVELSLREMMRTLEKRK